MICRIEMILVGFLFLRVRSFGFGVMLLVKKNVVRWF